MNFVIFHKGLGGFIEKRDAMNIGHADPDLATRFDTREEAESRRPGHSRDMGGAGFSGAVMTIEAARAAYRNA